MTLKNGGQIPEPLFMLGIKIPDVSVKDSQWWVHLGIIYIDVNQNKNRYDNSPLLFTVKKMKEKKEGC